MKKIDLSSATFSKEHPRPLSRAAKEAAIRNARGTFKDNTGKEPKNYTFEHRGKVKRLESGREGVEGMHEHFIRATKNDQGTLRRAIAHHQKHMKDD